MNNFEVLLNEGFVEFENTTDTRTISRNSLANSESRTWNNYVNWKADRNTKSNIELYNDLNLDLLDKLFKFYYGSHNQNKIDTLNNPRFLTALRRMFDKFPKKEETVYKLSQILWAYDNFYHEHYGKFIEFNNNDNKLQVAIIIGSSYNKSVTKEGNFKFNFHYDILTAAPIYKPEFSASVDEHKHVTKEDILRSDGMAQTTLATGVSIVAYINDDGELRFVEEITNGNQMNRFKISSNPNYMGVFFNNIEEFDYLNGHTGVKANKFYYSKMGLEDYIKLSDNGYDTFNNKAYKKPKSED